MADRIGKPVSQRQLRVGEMIKQSLSMIFIRNEAKVPNLETNTITVTEVRMSQDLYTQMSLQLQRKSWKSLLIWSTHQM